jgi:purine-binding chemotaxis protein CheW
MAKQRPDPRKSLVGFRVGNIEYAVPIHAVKEIVSPLPITPLPHSPPAVAGVADHRGEVIPIVDLRVRFGLAAAPLGPKGKWILLHVERRLIGLAVDSVTEVFGTAGVDLRPAPELGQGDRDRGIAAVTSHNGQLVLVLDVGNFDDLTAPAVPAALPALAGGAS